MATRKTVDQILDGAADVLEKHGWVTGSCYDDATGGSCALGAITRTVHPRLKLDLIENASYVTDFDLNEPDSLQDYKETFGVALNHRHHEAVTFLGRYVDPNLGVMSPAYAVYRFNDGAIDYFDKQNPQEVLKSARKVVRKLRNAAKAYRKQQEKAAA